MDRKTANLAIQFILTEIRERVDEAAGISRAAIVCADADNVEQGVKISMDIEQLLYEAGRLQDAVSLLNRISQK